MTTEYQVVTGRRRLMVIGAGFDTRQAAVDYMIRRQLEYKQRGMRVVKLVPYGAGGTHRQVIELKGVK